MIHFNFTIRNPFSSKFENLFCKSGKFSKNTAWEVEAVQSSILFEFEFRYTIREDHAGAKLEFGLFGYSISAQYYDIRHWDYDTNKWVKYD
jgi:hypothetical protein